MIALIAAVMALPAARPVLIQGDDQKNLAAARIRVEERLKELSAQHATVTLITEESIEKMIPGYRVFSVRFRMYPVAMLAPEPLKSQNLFFVPERGAMRVVHNSEELGPLFKSLLRPVTGELDGARSVKAWLRLTEELTQDGFYKFGLDEASVKTEKLGSGWKASGRTEVTSGGKGEISVTLDFNPIGRLVRIDEKSTVKPGVRPICQATKLLDKDPIVRKMAEQDILVMGRAAKPYLDDQRAKAKPAQQKAIDRIWKRVLSEGW